MIAQEQRAGIETSTDQLSMMAKLVQRANRRSFNKHSGGGDLCGDR